MIRRGAVGGAALPGFRPAPCRTRRQAGRPAPTPVLLLHRIDRASGRIYNRCGTVSRMRVTRLSITCISLFSLAAAGWILEADDQPSQPPARSSAAPRETISKPLTEREEEARGEAPQRAGNALPEVAQRRRGLHHHRRRASAFKRLQTDEEREQFIEQFWLRRDPTPDTEENEFKEEHYRRIAYANDNFASGIPGLEDGSRPHLYHVRAAR